MSSSTYDQPRSTIPAEVRRFVLVEAGHSCSVKECREHTYIELHHIDEDRENNDPSNLITLCDKHHKMAHRGLIDRKSLRLYKKRLAENRQSEILERLTRLEAQRGETRAELPVAEPVTVQPVDTAIRKSIAVRYSVQAFALCQVAITRYEKDTGIFFERHVEWTAGDKSLVLDGFRQMEGDGPDIIIDFSYLRKAYLDGPAYRTWLQDKLDVYEIMTGRAARGVMLVAVGRETMLDAGGLPQIRESVRTVDDIALQAYSCAELGFHPGAISAALL